jgi:FMN phosphatase YigB (HAD superfamily)
MKILTDVDGVLLNWEDSFLEWMNAQGYTPTHNQTYNIWRRFPDLDEDHVGDLIRTFNSSATMGFLPPLRDAVYWVRKMHEHHGVVFHCITSMGTDYHAQTLRRMNLERIFGSSVIGEVTILPCGADKHKALLPFKKSNLIWLEDNLQNAVTGAKLGLRTYLFNQTYNDETKFDQHFTRVNSWKELYNDIFQ